ncbi:MAG TPA: pyrroline-5-carboxylate reductase [Acetobacteraceae bacterium]|nr:pyrroline-5-carboxylate reductase [Acetobacteraceae bacterium]
MSRAAIPPILLVGCGRMGGALLAGWRERGLAPSVAVDPAPEASRLAGPDLQVVAEPAAIPPGFTPAAVVLAIKPQAAAATVPAYTGFAGAAVVLSIMAGRTIGGIRGLLGPAGGPAAGAVVRAMPNTPAAIRQGVTVACPGPGVAAAQRALCESLLGAIGVVAWVADEALLDPVTAVSGSGPAYVFLLAELLERAAIEQGIPPDLARLLARQTVAGSGALLAASAEDAAALRRAVTSPAGTTERALEVLMAPDAWPAVLSRAVDAATRRSRELAG